MIPAAIADLLARQGVQTAWRIAKVAVPALVIVGLIVAVILLREQRDHANDRRDALLSWQASVVTAVTDETVPADARGRRQAVDPATVATRIHGLGADVHHLQDEIARQNEAIRAAQVDGEARVADAVHNSEEAQRRNAPREATRHAIEQPGRTNGLTEAEWGQL